MIYILDSLIKRHSRKLFLSPEIAIENEEVKMRTIRIDCFRYSFKNFIKLNNDSKLDCVVALNAP